MPTAKNSKPKYDDFVDAVRPNPKNKEALLLLQGYIGKSSANNHVRIYADPSLNEFIDIPEADIVHCIPVKDDPLGLGGSNLWVRLRTGNKKEALETFTQGDLLNDYLENMYEREKASPNHAANLNAVTDITRVFATDITRPQLQPTVPTLATDITKPTLATDITKTTFATDITRPTWLLATDITKVLRQLTYTYITRKITFATRGCPVGFNRIGAANNGYYY